MNAGIQARVEEGAFLQALAIVDGEDVGDGPVPSIVWAEAREVTNCPTRGSGLNGGGSSDGGGEESYGCEE